MSFFESAHGKHGRGSSKTVSIRRSPIRPDGAVLSGYLEKYTDATSRFSTRKFSLILSEGLLRYSGAGRSVLGFALRGP
jgi:hypothetical protein